MKREAEAMLHLDEVITAEIYARRGIIVEGVKRGKEVLKPWVSSGVSFGTFLLLMKEKYEHSRVNPSASLRSAPPPPSLSCYA